MSHGHGHASPNTQKQKTGRRALGGEGANGDATRGRVFRDVRGAGQILQIGFYPGGLNFFSCVVP